MEIKEKEKKQIVIIDKNENVRSENYGFPFYRSGITYGILSGVLMTAVTVGIAMLAGPDNLGWSYLKYIVLGLALGQLLQYYKQYLPEGKVFKDGMLLGLLTSVVAAITMAAANFIAGLAGLEAAFFLEYGLATDSLSNAVVLNIWVAFEGLVYGIILTFIWLQFLKDGKPAE